MTEDHNSSAKRQGLAACFLSAIGCIGAYLKALPFAERYASPGILALASNIGILIMSGTLVIFAWLMVLKMLSSFHQEQQDKRPSKLAVTKHVKTKESNQQTQPSSIQQQKNTEPDKLPFNPEQTLDLTRYQGEEQKSEDQIIQVRGDNNEH